MIGKSNDYKKNNNNALNDNRYKYYLFFTSTASWVPFSLSNLFSLELDSYLGQEFGPSEKFPDSLAQS